MKEIQQQTANGAFKIIISHADKRDISERRTGELAVFEMRTQLYHNSWRADHYTRAELEVMQNAIQKALKT